MPLYITRIITSAGRSTVFSLPRIRNCTSFTPVTKPLGFARAMTSVTTRVDGDGLSGIFTDEVSESVLNFWFAGSDPHPTKEQTMRWFKADDEFDGECRSKFAPLLSKLISHPVSSITSLATSPSRALSLILLLDQIPRNIFRGDLSAQVYTETDPLAVSVALHSVSPSLRYDLGPDNAWSTIPSKRMWFYLPFSHSEDLALHKRVADELAKGTLDSCIEEEKRDGKSPGLDMANLLDTHVRGHIDVLEKFGRYPYRNKVLGRENTPEEITWLETSVSWAR